MVVGQRANGVCAALAIFSVAGPADAVPSVPLGLPQVAIAGPKDRDLADLGCALFFDKQLSVDKSISCGTCHLPERAFTDGRRVAVGLQGRTLTRRTPSLWNVRFSSSLFWDGRASDLVAQARTPLLARAEHGFANPEAIAAIVRADSFYVRAIGALFDVAPQQISLAQVTAALAAFERTLLAADSPFDQYLYGGRSDAMSRPAVRGLQLFRGRAQCATCHRIGPTSALFTDNEFHSSPMSLPDSVLTQLGSLSAKVIKLRAKTDGALDAIIATDPNIAALGRFLFTLDPKDIGLFKTPSLRNIALRPPYMHNGSIESLPKAVDAELYNRARSNYPLVLTEDERSDLLAFLNALTSATTVRANSRTCNRVH
jgi:cytochrome c peroxidase